MIPDRVVLVSPLPPPVSGIGRWTEVVLRELAKRGDIEVALVDTAVRWRGVLQLEWWRRALGGAMQSARDTWRLWRALRQVRPQAMHLCTSAQISVFRDIAMLTLARLLRVRSCYHLHFGRVPDIAQRRTLEWRLLRVAARLASVVIPIDAGSEAVLAAKLPAGRVLRLPNCLDLEQLEADRDPAYADDRKPGVARVTFIGHVKEPKGVLELVLAAREVASRIPLEVEVIGPVDEGYRDRMIAETGDFAARILFRGSWVHAQTMEALRRTDVLALPSYTEGFPNVVMEAMALGKPVVGTDVGAIAEMLQAGTAGACGLVVEPRQSATLAVALETLLGDPAGATRLGALGRERFRANYSSQAVVERLVRCWSGAPGG